MTDKTSFTSQPSEHLPTSSEEARSKASISEGILLLAMEVILRMACLCCWSSCDKSSSNLVIAMLWKSGAILDSPSFIQ